MNKHYFVWLFTFTGFLALGLSLVFISNKPAVANESQNNNESENQLVSREYIKMKREEVIGEAKRAGETSYTYQITGTLPNMR